MTYLRLSILGQAERLGTPLSVLQKQGGTFDPVTSTRSEWTTVTVVTRGTVRRAKIEEVNGDAVSLEDVFIIVPSKPFENKLTPQTGDFVQLNGESLSVMRARPHWKRNEVVAYEIQARGQVTSSA